VNPGELTPGISAGEYEQRRRRLLDALPEDSVVVSVSAPVKYMSGSKPLEYAISLAVLTIVQISCTRRVYATLQTHTYRNSVSYKYRQASDFWYLTGFNEPDSALTLGWRSHVDWAMFG
jgi:intermediate cleaving peptidase 55